MTAGKVLTIALNPSLDKSHIVERLKVGGVHTAAETYAVAGGKANNVARVLRYLHHEVRATGFIGGSAGEWIASKLAAAGVEVDFIKVDGETRTCLAIVDRGRGIVTELRERGAEVPVNAQNELLARLPRLASGCRVAAVCGSLPPGIPAKFLAQLVSVLRALGCEVILDTSGDGLVVGLRAQPTLIKPNEAELSELIGRDISTAGGRGIAALTRAASDVAAANGVSVVVSLGAHGAHWAKPDRSGFTVRAPDVEAVNTVGAGDSLVAGIVSGILQGYDPEESLRLGVACGTASVLSHEVAVVNRCDVDKLLAQMGSPHDEGPNPPRARTP